jgi:hypothetical protein
MRITLYTQHTILKYENVKWLLGGTCMHPIHVSLFADVACFPAHTL